MGILARLINVLMQEAVPEAAAGYYDALARKIAPGLYEDFVEAVAQRLDPGRILDVGTGPGYVPIEIAKRNKEVFIDGIDLTRNFKRIGERNAAEAGVSARVHFVVGDASRMQFEDGSYDMVISTGAMHHWKRPDKVLDEMWRVLRPGGEAWILDPNKECSMEEWDAFLDKIIELSGVGFFGRLWLRYGVRQEIKWSCYTRAQIEDMARASRFSSCDIQTHGVYMTIRLKKE